MAAIAKFVSYDGGIAFSDSVLKIQKREDDRGRLIPLESVAGIEVEEPLLGDDGCVHVQIVGKRLSARNTIYFDEEQYDDALRFKAAFDSFVGQTAPALPPLEMFQPAAITRRPQREQTRYAEPERPRRPVRQSRRKRRFRWWYAAIAVVLIAVLATPGKKEDEREHQESAVFATTEPTATPEPTVEPTPEATPFVGYTSPPLVTAPPAQEQTRQQTDSEVTYHGYSANTTVYVSSKNKIHLKSNCSGMKNYTKMTLGEAEKRGYEECSNCF